jgi:predicted dithiol-disulfide oxidoreductase (DUF899 family)
MMDAEILKAASAMPRWPANTSGNYIKARNELLREEYELRNHIERVAAMRRALPTGAAMPPYTFDEGPFDLKSDEPVEKTTLDDLAADGRSVVLYHFMYDPTDDEPCGMCSMIVDSFNGVGKHLAQNVNFAIVGKAKLSTLRDWARKRGWNNIRILSSGDNSFNADMNVENPTWAKELNQIPGISIFRKDTEKNVRHIYTAFASIEPKSERGLDLLATTYNVLDLTPEGRGQWYATNNYT